MDASGRSHPLPTSPVKGEVSAGVWGRIAFWWRRQFIFWRRNSIPPPRRGRLEGVGQGASGLWPARAGAVKPSYSSRSTGSWQSDRLVKFWGLETPTQPPPGRGRGLSARGESGQPNRLVPTTPCHPCSPPKNLLLPYQGEAGRGE